MLLRDCFLQSRLSVVSLKESRQDKTLQKVLLLGRGYCLHRAMKDKRLTGCCKSGRDPLASEKLP